MFFSVELLGRTRPLGIVWLAGTLRRSKIPRSVANSLHRLSFKDIENICAVILQPEAGVPLSLRTRGILLAGVTQIFLLKVSVLEKDAVAMLDRIQRKLSAPMRRNIDLDADGTTCAASINLPAVTESHTLRSSSIDVEFLFSAQQEQFTHISLPGAYQHLALRPQIFDSAAHISSDTASNSPSYLSRANNLFSRANRALGHVDTTARAGHAELSDPLDDDIALIDGLNNSGEHPVIELGDLDSDHSAHHDLSAAEAADLGDILLPPEPFGNSAFTMLPVDVVDGEESAPEYDLGSTGSPPHNTVLVPQKHKRVACRDIDDKELILDPQRRPGSLIREKTTQVIRRETSRLERAKFRFESAFVLKSLRSRDWTASLKSLGTALDLCFQRSGTVARKPDHALHTDRVSADEVRDDFLMEEQSPIESNLDSAALDDIQINNPLLSLIRRLSIIPWREDQEVVIDTENAVAEPADPPPDVELPPNDVDVHELEPLKHEMSTSSPVNEDNPVEPQGNMPREVSFGFILAGLEVSIQKSVVARTFMQLLILANQGQIKLRQLQPYQEIRAFI